MKILIHILLVMLIANPVFADSSSASIKLDLELKLQEKLKAILQPVDPQAQVVVTVKSRMISSDLPGLNFGVENFETSTSGAGFKFDDIERINIKIYSRLKTLPIQLKQLLESAVTIEPNKKSIEYLNYDLETLKSLDQAFAATPLAQLQQDTSKMGKYFDDSKQGFGVQQSWPLILGGFCFAILAGLLIAALKSGVKILREGLDSLASAMGKESTVRPMRETIDMKPAGNTFIPAMNPTALANENSIISDLHRDSVLALFSDAYWCKKDGYASWLWTQLNNGQKIEILNSLSFGISYANCLPGITPICDSKFHLLPYYLQPQNVNEVSQEDLYLLVKKNSSLWHFLSPMRKSEMQISIQERIQFETAAKILELPPVPVKSINQRLLVNHVQSAQLTNEDDQSILENPSLVPPERRSDFLSLAWVAILPLADQQKLFYSFNASEIAQIWTASPAVLEILEIAVGPKKMKLVQDFIQRRPASRDCAEYRNLVMQAIQILALNHSGEQEVRSRAA